MMTGFQSYNPYAAQQQQMQQEEWARQQQMAELQRQADEQQAYQNMLQQQARALVFAKHPAQLTDSPPSNTSNSSSRLKTNMSGSSNTSSTSCHSSSNNPSSPSRQRSAPTTPLPPSRHRPPRPPLPLFRRAIRFRTSSRRPLRPPPPQRRRRSSDHRATTESMHTWPTCSPAGGRTDSTRSETLETCECQCAFSHCAGSATSDARLRFQWSPVRATDRRQRPADGAETEPFHSAAAAAAERAGESIFCYFEALNNLGSCLTQTLFDF